MTQEFSVGTVCEVHGYVAMDKKHLNGKRCTIQQYKHVSNGYMVEFESSPYEHYNEWKFIHSGYLRLAPDKPTKPAEEPTTYHEQTTSTQATTATNIKSEEEAPPDYASTLVDNNGETQPFQTNTPQVTQVIAAPTTIVRVIHQPVVAQPPVSTTHPATKRGYNLGISDSPILGICLFYCSFFCCCIMTIFLVIGAASSSAGDYFEGSTVDKCIWNGVYNIEYNSCTWRTTGKCRSGEKCSCTGSQTRFYINTLNNTCSDGSLTFISDCYCNVDWFTGPKFPPETPDSFNQYETCYIQECGGELYGTWTIVSPEVISAFGDSALVIAAFCGGFMLLLCICGCWKQKVLCFK